MDYEKKYRNLRNSIIPFCYEHTTSSMHFKYENQAKRYHKHMQRNAAQSIGLKMLEEGMIFFREFPDDDDGFHRVRATCWISNPDASQTPSEDLRIAEKAGVAKTILKMRAEAKILRENPSGVYAANIIRDLAWWLQKTLIDD